MKKDFRVVLSVFVVAVSYLYGIVRYNIFDGVSWSYLPLFITNKAISFSAIVFIALSCSLGAMGRLWPGVLSPALNHRKYFGLLGFFLAVVHSIISVLIFKPEYYDKFFTSNGQLSFSSELSMFFGVFAFSVFALMAIVSLPGIAGSINRRTWIRIQKYGPWGLLLTLLHLVMMGYTSWLDPASWPGGLLPISLTAAVVVGLAITLKVFSKLFKPRRKENLTHKNHQDN